MEAMACRAGNAMPYLTASGARASFSKSSRRQCATLLGGPHSPHLALLRVKALPQRNVSRSVRFILFAKADDGHEEAVEDSEIQALPRPEFQTASLQSWVAVSFGGALLFSAAFLPSLNLGPLEFLRRGLYVVGSPQMWQSVLYVGAFLHVLEAAFAAYLARRVDPQNEALWIGQTLFLGFFSLNVLLQKSKQEADLKQNS